MLQRIEFTPDATAALAGLRLVDFSRFVVDNMLRLQRAGQGAEVVKVECGNRKRIHAR